MHTAVQVKSIDVIEEIEAYKRADSSSGESVFDLMGVWRLFSHNSMFLRAVVAISDPFSHNSMILGSVVAISHLFSYNSMNLRSVVAISHPFSHNSMILGSVVAIWHLFSHNSTFFNRVVANGRASNKISPSHAFIKDNILRI